MTISTDIEKFLSKEFANIGRLDIILGTMRTHLENRRDEVRQVLLGSLGREKRCSKIYGCSEYFYFKKIYTGAALPVSPDG